jgi:hypothetical protein
MSEAGKIINGQLVVFFNMRHLLEPSAIIGIAEGIKGGSVRIRYDQESCLNVPIADVLPIQNSLAILAILGRTTPTLPNQGAQHE